MVERSPHTVDSEAVRTHVGIVQSVIERMASNSASCKSWCVTLVSAILVVVADKSKPQYALIAVIPTILFLFLDSYYLALERMFRQSYNSFIEKVHSGNIEITDLYAVSPSGDVIRTLCSSLFSFSVWPFYLSLLGMIWIARTVIL